MRAEIKFCNHLGHYSPSRKSVPMRFDELTFAEALASRPLPCAADDKALGFIFRTMDRSFSVAKVIPQPKRALVVMTAQQRADRVEQILKALKVEGPMNTGQLSAQFDQHTDSMRRMLIALETLGLVKRTTNAANTKWSAAS